MTTTIESGMTAAQWRFFDQIILDRIDELTPRGTECWIANLRSRLGAFSRSDFDAKLAELSMRGLVALAEHDHPYGISREDFQALAVIDGRYYCAVARR